MINPTKIFKNLQIIETNYGVPKQYTIDNLKHKLTKEYLLNNFRNSFHIPFKYLSKYLSNPFLKGIKVHFSPFERYERTMATLACMPILVIQKNI